MREETEDFFRWQAHKLSETQQQYLMDHVDGRRPVINDRGEGGTRHALVQRGLVKYHPANAARPQQTIITDRGRGVLCAILGMMGDALQRKEISMEGYGYGYVNRRNVNTSVLDGARNVQHAFGSPRKSP